MAWEWFRTEHTDLPHRLALRTGQIFRLQDDRIAQFENCNFRGYTTADHKKKNPFADKDFEVAMQEFKRRNTVRINRQKEAKEKRERKLVEKAKKKRKGAKLKKRVKGGLLAKPNKKRRRVSLIISEDKPVDIVVPPLLVRNQNLVNPVKEKKHSVQRDTFNNRRVSTETFLASLQKHNN